MSTLTLRISDSKLWKTKEICKKPRNFS